MKLLTLHSSRPEERCSAFESYRLRYALGFTEGASFGPHRKGLNFKLERCSSASTRVDPGVNSQGSKHRETAPLE